MPLASLPPPSRGDGRALRVGLLGGSFNPAHDGHLHISREALRLLALDEVWWLVSPQNPLKSTQGMAPLAERLASARRIAARDHRIRATALEKDLGTRYTVDTVHKLQQRFPRARFVWLMGEDNLRQFPRWRRWKALFHMLPIAVFARSSYSFRALAGLAARRFGAFRIADRAAWGLADRKPPAWVFLHIRRHPASATEIRKSGSAGHLERSSDHRTSE